MVFSRTTTTGDMHKGGDMPLKSKRIEKCAAAFVGMAIALALALTALVSYADAQTKPDEAKQEGAGLVTTRPSPQEPVPESVETIFLTNVQQQNDLNDIQTDIRNILPRAKIYGLPSQNAITIEATPEDLEVAKKLVADLDRPKPLYRLTYTITDFDSGKRTGSQSVAVLAVLGQRSIFKHGTRVPIVTGSYDSEARNSNTQVQYQDLGLSIEATVDGSADGLTLRTKIEQSSLAQEKSATAEQDPIVRQTVLQETGELVEGKPLALGALDIPGTTQRQQIEVTAELVH
jgi:type II secretory pathway component GspD/PulD (secretin)